MAWNPSIPQPGDIPAQSQDLILQNFQYLNTFVQGQGNALLLNQQATAPTVTATQVGIYNLLSGGTSTLMIKKGAAAAIDILTDLKAANGWCQLPSGIIIQWGSSATTNAAGGTTITFAAGGFTTACYSVTATDKDAFGNRYFVQVNSVTKTNFKCRVSDSAGNAIVANIYYTAIGY